MNDKEYLTKAMALAEQSLEPVGCGVIIVSKGLILAQAHNSQLSENIAINHAEINAIILANKKVGSRKLEEATAYCSCEPCAMCLTALSYAKVERIVYNQAMLDLFPNDPQSQLDAQQFIKGLNFVPLLEQIVL
jgi:tRNA(Arg) A34 adenosine deaminase TadA